MWVRTSDGEHFMQCVRRRLCRARERETACAPLRTSPRPQLDVSTPWPARKASSSRAVFAVTATGLGALPIGTHARGRAWADGGKPE